MDKMYWLNVIRQIEQERERHDTKFADNPAHANCLPRFDDVLLRLRKELNEAEKREEVQEQ